MAHVGSSIWTSEEELTDRWVFKSVEDTSWISPEPGHLPLMTVPDVVELWGAMSTRLRRALFTAGEASSSVTQNPRNGRSSVWIMYERSSTSQRCSEWTTLVPQSAILLSLN